MNTQVQSMQRDLPILRHFETSQLAKSVDSFRKGEKPMFNIFKLAFLGVILWGTWVYVLPPVFAAIGQALAVASTAIIAVAGIFLAPVIIKGIRRFTRAVHKLVIKHDPFGQLYDERDKMHANKRSFQTAKGKLKGVRNEMEVSAAESEDAAKAIQNKIKTTHVKASKLKATLDELTKKHGVKAKGMDAYVNTHAEYFSAVTDAQRYEHSFNQHKNFIVKYGTRAAILKKFDHKLIMVETAMNAKILDFDATIEILKRDYESAEKMRQATDAAKSAMGETKGWELDYALDVVTSTIAEDIAITAGNLKDIDLLTANYSTDSDELYSKLEILADDINTGREVIPSAKDYSGHDYELTHEDKIKSEGFANIF